MLHFNYNEKKNTLSDNFGHFLGFSGRCFDKKWAKMGFGNFKSFLYLRPPNQTTNK
jgi:hypothetical protein